MFEDCQFCLGVLHINFEIAIEYLSKVIICKSLKNKAHYIVEIKDIEGY